MTARTAGRTGREAVPGDRLGMALRRILSGMAAAALTLPLLAGPAQAQAVTFSFSPNPVEMGGSVDFTGTGCAHDASSSRADGQFIVWPGTETSGSYLTAESFFSDSDGSFSGTTNALNGSAGEHATTVLCHRVEYHGAALTLLEPAPVDNSSSPTPTEEEESTPTTVAARVAAPTTIAVASIPLARTGSSVAGLVFAAVVLLIVGTVLATQHPTTRRSACRQ